MRELLFAVLIFLIPVPEARAGGTPPQRVVSINLCTDELLIKLVDPGRIAAVTAFAGNERNSTVYKEARGMPKLKGDIEEVLAFEPDLVVGGTFSNRQTLAFLKRLEIPSVILEVAEDFEDVYANIRKLAAALGEETRGEALIAEMQAGLEALRRQPSGRKALFYQSAGNVPGGRTFQDSILHQAGLVNLAAELGYRGHGRLPLELLLFHRPEVLLFLDLHRSRASIGRELLFHPALRHALGASEKITLPSKYLNCGAPSSLKALELLNEKLAASDENRSR